MDYQIITAEQIFVPETCFRECHASTVCILPNGEIGAAWFGGDHEKADNVAIWFSRREPAGWTFPAKAADVEGIPCWNPVLFVSGEKTTLFFKAGKQIPEWKTFTAESLDSGASWSAPRELVPGDTGGRGPVKNKCIVLADGAVLAPASTETKTTWNCFADRSEDGGKTWRRSADFPLDRTGLKGKGIIQPTFWQDDSGMVHAFMRSTEDAIFCSRSSDGGRTWAEAVPTRLPNNCSGIDLTRLADGRIALVCNPVAGDDRSPVSLLLSEDNGENWSRPQAIEQGEGEYSYPAVISQGTELYLTYTRRRKTIMFWHLRLPEAAAGCR